MVKAGPDIDDVVAVAALLTPRPWASSNPRRRLIYTADRVDRPTGRRRGSMTHASWGHSAHLPSLPHSRQVAPSPQLTPSPQARQTPPTRQAHPLPPSHTPTPLPT